MQGCPVHWDLGEKGAEDTITNRHKQDVSDAIYSKVCRNAAAVFAAWRYELQRCFMQQLSGEIGQENEVQNTCA